MSDEIVLDAPQSAPLLVFTVYPYPNLPALRLLKDGDDVDAVIKESFAGKAKAGAEPIEQPLDDMAKQLGILRLVKIEVDGGGYAEAQVHSHPDAEVQLKILTKRMELEVKLNDVLRASGLVGPPREDGCICGHCPLPGQEEAESAIDAANSAEGKPSRWN